MAKSGPITDPSDIQYIRANFIDIRTFAKELGETADSAFKRIQAGELPRPSYVFEDGTAYFPAHPRDLVCERDVFVLRALAEAKRKNLDYGEEDALRDWDAFMGGGFSVCLKRATPENIIAKEALMRRIDWLREALHDAVDELDQLELPFSPIFDQTRFGLPPSRVRYITNIRERFPRT